MIHVIATITISNGRRDKFLAAFQDLVPQVRAEKGCIEYGPTVDLASGLAPQPAVRANVVTVVEKWEDLGALKNHLNAPHMQQFREKAKSLLVSLEIQVLAPA